jgi:hypothetical protein
MSASLKTMTNFERNFRNFSTITSSAMNVTGTEVKDGHAKLITANKSLYPPIPDGKVVEAPKVQAKTKLSSAQPGVAAHSAAQGITTPPVPVLDNPKKDEKAPKASSKKGPSQKGWSNKFRLVMFLLFYFCIVRLTHYCNNKEPSFLMFHNVPSNVCESYELAVRKGTQFYTWMASNVSRSKQDEKQQAEDPSASNGKATLVDNSLTKHLPAIAKVAVYTAVVYAGEMFAYSMYVYATS